MATRGHLVVPTSMEESEEIIEMIQARLTGVFGGVSMYDGSGAWNNGMEVVTEPHTRFVVTGQDSGRIHKHITDQAEYVKEELDEDAVLVEFEDVQMELV